MHKTSERLFNSSHNGPRLCSIRYFKDQISGWRSLYPSLALLLYELVDNIEIGYLNHANSSIDST